MQPVDPTPEELFSQDFPLGRLVPEEGRCFLCGKELNGSGTREHVIPKWLQDRYGLWDETVTLLNGTRIPYRKLVIPCCDSCNGEHLAELEAEVATAVRGGYEGVRALPPWTLFLWAGKIFFGLLYREGWLAADRRNRESGPIVGPDDLEAFQTLHGMLQVIRRPARLGGELPFSVLVANLHQVEDLGPWDLRDSTLLMQISLRMGEIGLIVALQDCGVAQQTYGRLLDHIDGQPLHPLQFTELIARVQYQLSLIESRPTFLFGSAGEGTAMSFTNLTPGVQCGEWRAEDLAPAIDFHWRDWKQVPRPIYDAATGAVRSFLFGPDGAFVARTADGDVQPT